MSSRGVGTEQRVDQGEPKVASVALSELALSPEEIRRMRGGDQALVTRFVRWIGPIVLAVARRIVWRWGLPAALVDDLTQEVMLALFSDGWSALARWDPGRGRGLRNFLMVFAYRKIIDHVRKNGHHVPTLEAELIALIESRAGAAPGASQDPFEFAMLDELQRRFQEECSDDERLLLNRLLEGATTDELCAELDCLPGALFARISRVRKRLRVVLSEMDK